jgi:hypothetical protein
VESEEEARTRVWRVDLPDHKTYRHTNLKRNFADDDTRYAVVTVDARKLLAALERDRSDYVLPPVLDWYPGKRNGLRDFLNPGASRIPEMPYVTIKVRRSGFLFLQQEAIVSFRNGQHRARYMTDAGAESFPVEVDQGQAALLGRFCGA